MAYKLHITENAEQLLDQLVRHLLYKFRSESAARHLLDSIGKLYERLEENPYQFPNCRDPYLERRGYKKAVVSGMDYILIFRIDHNIVYVLGIFHQLENYKDQLEL